MSESSSVDPPGNLWVALVDGAEMTFEFPVQTEYEIDFGLSAARTGNSMVLLKKVLGHTIQGGECLKDTGITVDFGGQIAFAVVDMSTTEGGDAFAYSDGIACEDEDIDGDQVCENSTGQDNCSGFAYFNRNQDDQDGDGYGNVCDTDVNGDCITGGLDISAIFGHLGDASPTWCGHGDPCTGGPHDDVYDVNGDNVVGALDTSLAFGNLGKTIGPTADTSASPDPSCN